MLRQQQAVMLTQGNSIKRDIRDDSKFVLNTLSANILAERRPLW